MRLFTADRLGVGKQVFEEIFCRYGPKIGEWDGKETNKGARGTAMGWPVGLIAAAIAFHRWALERDSIRKGKSTQGSSLFLFSAIFSRLAQKGPPKAQEPRG